MIRGLAKLDADEIKLIKESREYWKTNQMIFATFGKLRSILRQYEKDNLTINQQAIPVNNQVQQVEMPKLDLPKFNGEFKNRIQFSAIFEDLVVNKPYENLTKFRYLLQALDEGTKERISGINVTGDNFTSAWGCLKNYFDDTRKLVNAELTRMFCLTKMNKASSAQVRELVARIDRSLGALTMLKRPANQWDDVIVFRITLALDDNLRTAWEKRLALNKTCPTWAEMRDFLKKKEITLEYTEQEQKNNTALSSNSGGWNYNKSRNQVHVHAVQPVFPKKGGRLPCPFCNSKDNGLYKCHTFGALHTRQKDNFVKSN